MLIRFSSIKIENFKSIELLETNLGDISTFIYGANETGKTSFSDAISWCLTGRNSLGESQFNFVPIGKDEVSPSVTLCIDISGKVKDAADYVILQRVYQAKQNKKKEFIGEYQTICFVNKLKVGVREFDKWVETHICNLEIFRLIHDVRYFTENIITSERERPWEAQRRLLFSISGIKSNIDFARSKKRFASILNGLQRYDNENQYLQFLKSEEHSLESQIQDYTTRIVAITSMLDKNVDAHDVENQIKKLQRDKDSLDKSIKEESERLLVDQELRIKDIKDQYEKEKIVFQMEQDEYSRKKMELISKRKKLYEQLTELKCLLVRTNSDLERKIESYNNIDIQCPTCGQYIPTDIIETEKSTLKSELDRLQETLKSIEIETKSTESELDKVESGIDTLKPPIYPKALDDIQTELIAAEKIERSQEGINNINKRAEIIVLLDSLIGKKQISNKNNQIEEEARKLESKVDELLDKKAENSRLLDLCRDFIDVKCKYAEKKVNDLFDGIEFKMFRQNKTNDEVRECCDIFWNGTPYDSLSYSAKFVVSMKIALAFQKFYNVSMPIVVDNAESIDLCADIPVQSILITKREELCECGGETGRKGSDGLWTCKECGNKFKKHIEIKIM